MQSPFINQWLALSAMATLISACSSDDGPGAPDYVEPDSTVLDSADDDCSSNELNILDSLFDMQETADTPTTDAGTSDSSDDLLTQTDSLDLPSASPDTLAKDVVEPDFPDTQDSPDVPHIRQCNGFADLCARRLDQVAFVTTHNAMANAEDVFAAPNQRSSVLTQLAGGVRAFMLDTHYLYEESPDYGDEVLLCHGPCALGQRPLVDTLIDMRVFLEGQPDDILVIIIESYVSAEHTRQSFDDAGMTGYLLDPTPGQPLPTLDEMIDSGKRMVVLTDHDCGGFPGYLPVWDWAGDNDWNNKVPEDLNCAVNRGNPANPFFILNHFLTNPFASEDLANEINFNPFFIDQAVKCRAERDHIPNFVTVDFAEIGDVMTVVDALNSTVSGD